MNKRRKGLIIIVLFFLTLAIITTNVFLVSVPGVHIYTQENLKAYTENLNYVEDIIYSRRGNIYDNNGSVLATDTQSYNLIAYLSTSRMNGNRPAHVVDKTDTASKLAPILQMDAQEVLAYLNKDLYQTEFGTKGRNLTLNQKRAIENLKLPGLGFVNSFTRVYPKGNLASNLLGLATYHDESKITIGRSGVESLYNDLLAGTNGTQIAQKDKYGFIIDQDTVTIEAADDGNDVYLTIDQSMQESLEASFKISEEDVGATLAFGAIMEIKTGKILAIGQSPALDLKNPTDNYYNYAVQGSFEPGSTMKAFSYAAYIDQGLYDEERLVDTRVFYVGSDNGVLYQSDVPTRHGTVTNAASRDYGKRTLDWSFPMSLNVVTSMMVDEMGADSYLQYLKDFGFLSPVDTDRLENPAGSIAYKYPLEQINTSFGQAVTVSTLQMLQAYSAILSDGTMVKPYIIDHIIDPETQELVYEGQTTIVGNPIKPTTAKKMQELMYDLIHGPYHYGNYATGNVEIMAKTGTAQVAMASGQYSKDETFHNVLIGLPAENPQYMFFYGYMAPSGNARAYDTREAHRNLVDAITIRYLRNQNQDDQKDHNNDIREILLPQLTNHTMNYVNQKVEDLDLNIVKIGHGDQVLAQLPLGNTTMLNNQVVFIKMAQADLTMINLQAMSRKDVSNFAQLTGLELEIEGQGSVTAQSIEVGQPIQAGDRLKVILE